MKPDDIEQWAWDEATAVARAWFHEEWNDDEPQDYMQDMLVKYIAQSLVKARSQAFEEASKIAENYREDMSFWMHSEWKAAKEASEFAGKSIAQAIRQHSQKVRDDG